MGFVILSYRIYLYNSNFIKKSPYYGAILCFGRVSRVCKPEQSKGTLPQGSWHHQKNFKASLELIIERQQMAKFA